MMNTKVARGRMEDKTHDAAVPGPVDGYAPEAPATRRAGGATIKRAVTEPMATGDKKASVLDSIKIGRSLRTETHEELGLEKAIFSAENFRLFYGAAQALYDVTMAIPAGKVTAMVGPSGCGKSTLLRSMNRLNDLIDGVRIEGDMRLGGESIYDRRVDVIRLRKRVGMVFQKSNPFPMSIFENVVYSLRINGQRDKTELMKACEKSLRGAALWDEVKDRLHGSALGLSGGQQQRLCIARAIAADPEVLLMDEPCSALDPIATGKVEDLMWELKGRYTIIIVTHSMQQAARVSDFTAFMYLGRLVEYGPTIAIFENPHLKETEDYVTGRFG